MELAPPVIAAGADEIGQYVVGVGGADQLADRQAHPPREFAGENIAEVAGRDDEVDLVAERDRSGQHQIGIGLEIVSDLRRKAAEVDGIRARQPDAGLCRPAVRLVVGEDRLDAGLCVVEIAADRADAHVRALLRDHLRALDVADAAVGIEHDDARARHIAEAFQRRLARVAAGGGEDGDFVRHAELFARSDDQPRQHGQRHILECGRRPAEQFEHIAIADGNHRRQLVGFKFAAVGALDQLIHFARGEVRKQLADDRGRDLDGRHVQQVGGADLHSGEVERRVQPAVRRDSAQNGLRAGRRGASASSAVILHRRFLISVFRNVPEGRCSG